MTLSAPSITTKFLSVQNNGLWTVGNTYTVSIYEYYRYLAPFLGDYVELIEADLAPITDTQDITTQIRGAGATGVGFLFKYGQTPNYTFTGVPHEDGHFNFVNPVPYLSGIDAGRVTASWGDSIYNYDDPYGMYSSDDCDVRNYSFVIPATATLGKYQLLFYCYYIYSDLTTGEITVASKITSQTYDIQIISENYIENWPPTNNGDPDDPDDPTDNDNDWNETVGTWGTYPNIETLGGGRFNQQLIAIGHKKLYFEPYLT